MRKMITVLMISIVGINGFAQQTNEKELSKLDLFNLDMEDLIDEGYTPFNFE
jgi:hypothetical protein